MQLVVLAAGMSKRYGKLKQLDEIFNNKSIMDLSIENAKKNGFIDIVLVVNPLTTDLFKKKYKDSVKYSIQDNAILNIDYDKPIGTAYALYAAKEYLKDEFVVMTADDYYGEETFKLSRLFFENNDNDYGIISYKLNNVLSTSGPVNRGIIYTKDNFLIDIKETKGIEKIDGIIKDKEGSVLSPDEKTGMGYYCLRKDIIPHLEKYLINFVEQKKYLHTEAYLPEFIMHLHKKEIKKIKVIETKDIWKGVTYITDKEEVIEYFKNNF